MEELPNLLTVGGISVVCILLLGVVKTTVPTFDTGRFGALLSIVIGIGLAVLANVTAVADTNLQIVEVFLTGILGGASASGIYSAGRGASNAVSSSTTTTTTESDPPPS